MTKIIFRSCSGIRSLGEGWQVVSKRSEDPDVSVRAGREVSTAFKAIAKNMAGDDCFY
jgi:hypothetical protein